MNSLLTEAARLFTLPNRMKKCREEAIELALAITHLTEGNKITIEELAEEIVGAQMTTKMLRLAINDEELFKRAEQRQMAKLQQAIKDECYGND